MRNAAKKAMITAAASALALMFVAPGTGVADERISTVSHGTFDKPEIGGMDVRVIGSGSSDLEGWTVYKGNVDVYGHQRALMDVRGQALGLNGFDRGGIKQTISVEPDELYRIKFMATQDTHEVCRDDANDKMLRQKFRVGVSGDEFEKDWMVNLGSLNSPYDGTDNDWASYDEHVFMSREDSIDLYFESATGADDWDCGPLITHVSVTEA